MHRTGRQHPSWHPTSSPGSLLTRTSLLASVLALVAACGAQASPSNSSGGSGKTIDIEYTAPLTGSGDITGIDGCDGEKLAAADINQAGGITKGPLRGAKIDVTCIDDGDNPSQDSSIAAQYVSNPNIWALGGFYASGDALAAAKVAQRAGLVILAANVAADFLTTQVHDVYVLNPTLESAGGAAADLCHAYYGATQIAGLNPDYSYIPGYMQGANQAIALDGTKLVFNDTWPDPSTTNWDPYLTKLNGSGAQCVLLGGYPPEQCEIAAQGRKLGLTQPMIDLTESYTSDSCQKAGGQYYQGLIFGNLLPAQQSSDALTTNVASEYQSKYGQVMTYQAAQAYNCVLAVQYAIQDGATSRTQLLSYLGRVSGNGVGGPVKFTNERVGFRYLTFEEVQADGSLAPIAEYGVYPNGTFKRVFVHTCSTDPSCQTRLGASA